MTAQEEFQAFLDAQKVEGYKLGDIEGSPEADMLKYTELKIAAEQEKVRIAKFQEAKQASFDELAQKHDAERIVLGQEWQTYEDNNYEIPQ